MVEFRGRCVLLDIEGTTSSIRFVHERMFPFVRERLDEYLAAHWTEAEIERATSLMARDLGHADFHAWLGAFPPAGQRRMVSEEVRRQMDEDKKATGLKELQGLIWRDGFESGILVAHIYDEVPAALDRWKNAGLRLFIYSSGSVAAQRLFFGHTRAGDLLPHFSGHFDTTLGSKREPESYLRIADKCEVAPGDMVFLSDLEAELDAARTAGLQTILSIRPENEPVPCPRHSGIYSFDELAMRPKARTEDAQTGELLG